jgi:uncharacterized membrane protein YphA (DoxX/SURF4 family)
VEEAVLLDVARVWLACVLILAGALKARRPFSARAYVRRRTKCSDSAAVTVVALVCIAEVGLGLSMLSGLFMRGAAVVAVGMLFAFTLLFISDTGKERSVSCGCFGEGIDTAPSRGVDIIRNIGMFGVASFVVMATRAQSVTAPVRDAAALGYGFMIVMLSAVVYLITSRLFVSYQET